MINLVAIMWKNLYLNSCFFRKTCTFAIESRPKKCVICLKSRPKKCVVHLKSRTKKCKILYLYEK